jgi:cystathionine beta-lyase family protein involved in aluminum resistance
MDHGVELDHAAPDLAREQGLKAKEGGHAAGVDETHVRRGAHVLTAPGIATELGHVE